MSAKISVLGNIPAEQFTATASGEQWLIEHPAFLKLAEQFCKTDEQPERLMEGPANSFIGSGNHSEVWGLGGIAVKVSTPTTGKQHRLIGSPKGTRMSRSFQPENLVHQFIFLNTVRHHLEDRTDGAICIPEQHFAFRTLSGHYLRAEEHMSEWMPLKNVVDADDYTNAEHNYTVNQALKRKVMGIIRPTKFRLGLTDLDLEDGMSLRSGNILVPIGTTEPESAPLCIIDQPGKGPIGRLGMTMLNALSQVAGEAEL